MVYAGAMTWGRHNAPAAAFEMGGHIIEQAGGIVVRRVQGTPQILLVQAKKDPSHWIFPKGHIERNERAVDAAVREVQEEAGVVARVLKQVDPPPQAESERVRVQYYLMAATGTVASREDRESRWCAPNEVIETITHDDARELLRASLPDIHAYT